MWIRRLAVIFIRLWDGDELLRYSASSFLCEDAIAPRLNWSFLPFLSCRVISSDDFEQLLRHGLATSQVIFQGKFF